MRRRRVLEVELDGVGSLVSGPGSRELVIETTGRTPVWSSIRKGWSLQEHTARDVVAAAELRNYDIVLTSPQEPACDQITAPLLEVAPDPGEGLW